MVVNRQFARERTQYSIPSFLSLEWEGRYECTKFSKQSSTETLHKSTVAMSTVRRKSPLTAGGMRDMRHSFAATCPMCFNDSRRNLQRHLYRPAEKLTVPPRAAIIAIVEMP